VFFYGAAYQKSQSAVFTLPPKKLSLQLSLEQSVGDVGNMLLDWKRVPQTRSRSYKSSVVVLNIYVVICSVSSKCLCIVDTSRNVPVCGWSADVGCVLVL